MSDEQRSGDEILELTEAMAEPIDASRVVEPQIPPPPPLPPRHSSPTADDDPPQETPPPPSVPIPAPPVTKSSPAPMLNFGNENSGVTAVVIRRISAPPLSSIVGGPSSTPPPPAQAPSTPPPVSASAVSGGLEDALMELGAEMVVDHPAESLTQEETAPSTATPSTPPSMEGESLPTDPSPPPATAPPPPPPQANVIAKPDAATEDDPKPEDIEVTVDVEVPMPPSTPPPPQIRTKSSTRHEEEEEEIDLAEAEEMTTKRRTAPPPLPTPGAPARPARMRRRRADKEWWADIFDDDYLALLPTPHPRDERREMDFIERALTLPAGTLVLDLACGNGRNTVGMARRGYRMVGVDLSLPMLARAGEAAQDADQKINFIHGDMRDLGFDKTFDGVFCVGTSFGYFDDVTNLKVVEGVARALKPGGQFLIEVANRDFSLERQPSLTWFEGAGSVCMEETEFNYHTSRLQVTRQVIFNSDGRQTRYELSIRLYSLHELLDMLRQVGFSITRVDGHLATPGAFFGVDSAHIAVLAKKNP